jgi:hypothetical protein
VLIVGQKRYAVVNAAIEATTLEAAPPLTGWVWQAEAELLPLLPDFVFKAVADLAGREESFTEDQVTRVLQVFAKDTSEPGVSYAYVGAGKLFRLAANGSLEAVDDPAAAACSWPLAHDVRPAAQSLGSRGCTDCHSPDAPMLFGSVLATGPLRTTHAAVTAMPEWHGLHVPLHRLFARAFGTRPLFKVALGLAAGAMALIVLAFVLPGVRRVSGYFGGKG